MWFKKSKKNHPTELTIDEDQTGDIKAELRNIFIEKKTIVKGNIYGRCVTVDGKVIGNISALESISINPGGEVFGTLAAPRIALSEDSMHDGKIDIKENPPDPGL